MDRAKPRSRRTITQIALIGALLPCALAAEYRSTSLDQSGQLHIVLDNGKEVLPAKLQGQVSFGAPAISPDRRTIGWLAMYPDPTVTYYKGAELPGKLVVYRDGRVLHAFPAVGTFYGWQFQEGGTRLAYCTGPTHGGPSECLLNDVDSGRVVDRWEAKAGTEPPEWAKALRP